MKKYYRSYKSQFMEGTPFSALAGHFAKNDLDTEIIHSENNMFDNSKKLLSDDVFENTIKEYTSFLDIAKKKGAKVNNGCNISCDLIREKLENDKMVILAGYCNNYLHAILICGYDDDKFIVCDPLYKYKQTKTYNEINDFMNTPLGKWCVVVGEKHTNKNI